MEGLDLIITDYHFRKTPWGDKRAKLLEVDITVKNYSKRTFHFFDVNALSDYGVSYPQQIGYVNKGVVRPNSTKAGKLVFSVDSKKRRYSLVFSSRASGEKLTQVPIN